MGFIYALRSEQEKTKHTSFWAIHFCVPVMGALLFLAYYSLYASTADSKKLKMILEITTTFFPLLISVIVGLNVALEEKASHFQTLLAVPNRHKNMLANLVTVCQRFQPCHNIIITCVAVICSACFTHTL